MRRSNQLRTRWAAIGAAVAVTLGGGAIQFANAAGSPASTFVAITPVRVLDTRDGTDVGLAGPFVSGVSQRLDVTGPIATTSGTQVVVPDGATGVSLNVTAIRATGAGFVSVRPGDATGIPATSNLNFNANTVVPNAVTVQVPTSGAAAGTIDIRYTATSGTGATNIAIDVVGYYTAAAAGTAGTPGPQGAQGPQGPKGDQGDPGQDAPDTGTRMWVRVSGNAQFLPSPFFLTEFPDIEAQSANVVAAVESVQVGVFKVQFVAVDTDRCSWTGSVTSATVGASPDPVIVTVESGPAFDELIVKLRTAAGSLVSSFGKKGFSLYLDCLPVPGVS